MAKKNQLTTSDHLEYPEFEKLLAGLRADKEYFWELYARLSFCTACRASDVLNLTWGNVLDASKITVTEKKTKKTRCIPFNKSVTSKIYELYRLMGKPDKDSPIFFSTVTGEPVTIQCVNKKLKQFKHKYRLQIDHFSTHTFRKTFGRYVYNTSEDKAEALLLLNKILNHSNLQVTKTYIGITQGEINHVYGSINF